MHSRREMNVAADTSRAGLGREGFRVDGTLAWCTDVAAEVWSRVATVAVLMLQHRIVSRALHWVADEHAEPRLEGCYGAWLGRNIVHQYTTIDLVAELVIELEPGVKLSAVEKLPRSPLQLGQHTPHCLA
jgi:hypothetical protein